MFNRRFGMCAGDSGEQVFYYLWFRSASPFRLKFNSKSWDGELYYSISGGEWIKIEDISTPITTVNNYIYLRGVGNTKINSTIQLANDSGDDVYCYGNVENLLDFQTVMLGEHPTMAERAFYKLFQNCTLLAHAPDLRALELTTSCYEYMFNGCTKLRTSPVISAESVTTRSCSSMFDGCISIVYPPELKATVLTGNFNYSSMFNGCVALVKTPVLPYKGDTGAYQMYTNMFDGCISLKKIEDIYLEEAADGAMSHMFQNCSGVEEIGETVLSRLVKVGVIACQSMFENCTGLKKAPSVLSATELERKCYFQMFNNCIKLENSPALPAVTLKQECYGHMFYGCLALKTAGAIGAVTAAPSSCFWMFYNCKALKEAPAMNVLNVAGGCFMYMFYGCSALEEPPVLPATVLAENCYYAMLVACTSLEKLPLLPATTLDKSCYCRMFSGCSKLKKVPRLRATILPDYCYNSMFWMCGMQSRLTAESGYQVWYDVPWDGGSAAAGTDAVKDMFSGNVELGRRWYLTNGTEIVG